MILISFNKRAQFCNPVSSKCFQNIINFNKNQSTMEVQNLGQTKTLTILCPMCGIQFSPTIGTICEACTMAKTDITIGITKESLINICRFCHRFMRPPWVHCQRDSKQLLALLLKKIKGLNRARIINAGFLWTEEHSKRIKVKITIEKELNNQTKIEQTFVTEFVQAHIQCDDCKKEFTPHTWGAVVQVRQHVQHKKTFFYLEQLILKHNAFDRVIKVSQEEDGLNFYYKTATHAQRLIDFLGNLLPITVKNSKQLISHDESSNVFSYKYTFSVNLPKICRNDLVVIPKKLAKQLGGTSQVLLCTKVAQHVGLVDLSTFNYLTMTSAQYYHYENDIKLLPLSKYKRQFTILDSNPVEKKKSRQIKCLSNRYVNKLYRYNVSRKDQYENIDIMGILGDLPCGAEAQGFDLRHMNLEEDVENIKGLQELILVKRTCQKNRSKRAFKLKKLEQEGVIIEEKPTTKNKKGKRRNDDNQDEDFQQFLDDVENDPGMRKNIKMYKNEAVLGRQDLKHKSKQELQEILGELDICQLLDDMKLDDKPNTYENELQGIDELIKGMASISIEKGEDYDKAEKRKRLNKEAQ